MLSLSELRISKDKAARPQKILSPHQGQNFTAVLQSDTTRQLGADSASARQGRTLDPLLLTRAQALL